MFELTGESLLNAMEGFKVAPHSSPIVRLLYPGVDPKGMGLASLKFPTSRAEAYRYGNVERFYGRPFMLGGRSDAMVQKFCPEQLFQCDVPRLDAEKIYLVNGQYVEQGGQRLRKLPNGAVWGSLRAAVEELPELVQRSITSPSPLDVCEKDCSVERILRPGADPFARVAELLSFDGFFLYQPERVELECPLQIISLIEGEGDAQLINTRHVIHLANGARGNLLLCGHSFTGQDSFGNSHVFIRLEEGAHLDLVSLESHFESTASMMHYRVHAARESEYNHTVVMLDGGYARSNVEVNLEGEHASCGLWGVLLGDRDHYCELHTRVNHNAPSTSSNQLVKGLADERAELAFHGLINVAPHAEGTKAYQRNANMVLSEEAKVHTRPQLLIHTDDVQCSHGATVGQIDELARFYMQQRGISPDEVNRLLMYAFVSDALVGITLDPLRTRLEQLVGDRIAGKRSSCYDVGCGVQKV